MRDEKDRGAKWMLSGYGGILLRGLAGVQGRILSCKALQPEVVQPKQVPDAILEVLFEGEFRPDRFLLEVATYPEKRVDTQVMRGACLVYLDQFRLPEVITLVLHPRNQVEVSGQAQERSRLGYTEMGMKWPVVNVFDLSAEPLLAMNEVGLVPWILLTRFSGNPEAFLRECRRRIDEQAPAAEHGNFLAVAQLLGRLRFDVPTLATIFGEKRKMIESPFIQDLLEDPEVVQQSPVFKQALADKDRLTQQALDNKDRLIQQALADLEKKNLRALAEMQQQAIQAILSGRFQSVPQDITTVLQHLDQPNLLKPLLEWAALCPSLDAFRARLSG